MRYFPFLQLYVKTKKKLKVVLGFWANEEYKRLTGFEAPLPPRHEKLSDAISIAKMRHLVKAANEADGIIDTREALDLYLDSVQSQNNGTVTIKQGNH